MDKKLDGQISIKVINEEMNQFVSKKPHWIITYGNGIFLGVVFLTILVLYFTPQQDNLNVTARIIPLNNNISIVTHGLENTVLITVTNNETVKRGQILAVINSRAKLRSVMALDSVLYSMKDLHRTLSLKDTLYFNSQLVKGLGEMQKPYSEFNRTFFSNSNNNNKIEAVKILKNQFIDWKLKHLIISPENGRVKLNNLFQAMKTSTETQVIMVINPLIKNYQVQLTIPQKDISKVNVGQRILLSFDAFPYKIYGKIKVKIDALSNIPTDSGFIAKANLHRDLGYKSSKKIFINEKLKVNGQIVIAQNSMLNRILPW